MEKKRYREIGTETCSMCCGTGRDLNSDLMSEPCRNDTCHQGKVSYCRMVTCNRCNGLGLVYD